MSITEKKAKIRKVQAPEQCAPVPPDGTPEDEKNRKVARLLVERHRDALQRLAKR